MPVCQPAGGRPCARVAKQLGISAASDLACAPGAASSVESGVPVDLRVPLESRIVEFEP